MHIRQSPHRPQALRSLQLLRTYSAPSLNWVGALRICEGYAQPRGGATETGSRGPSARQEARSRSLSTEFSPSHRLDLTIERPRQKCLLAMHLAHW